MRPSRERFQSLKRATDPISRTLSLERLLFTRWLDKACTKSIIFEASEKNIQRRSVNGLSLFLIKLQALDLRLQHQCFSVKFSDF